MSTLDLFTRLTGWILVAALAASVRVATRGRHMFVHYLLGWTLAVLTWPHFYYPMAGRLIGRTPSWGLWVAVVAWALLLAQLAVGNWLRARRGRTGAGVRGAHRLVMFAIVLLTAVHALVNGISLRAILPVS